MIRKYVEHNARFWNTEIKRMSDSRTSSYYCTSFQLPALPVLGSIL